MGEGSGRRLLVRRVRYRINASPVELLHCLPDVPAADGALGIAKLTVPFDAFELMTEQPRRLSFLSAGVQAFLRRLSRYLGR